MTCVYALQARGSGDDHDAAGIGDVEFCFGPPPPRWPDDWKSLPVKTLRVILEALLPARRVAAKTTARLEIVKAVMGDRESWQSLLDTSSSAELCTFLGKLYERGALGQCDFPKWVRDAVVHKSGESKKGARQRYELRLPGQDAEPNFQNLEPLGVGVVHILERLRANPQVCMRGWVAPMP